MLSPSETNTYVALLIAQDILNVNKYAVHLYDNVEFQGYKPCKTLWLQFSSFLQLQFLSTTNKYFTYKLLEKLLGYDFLWFL